MEEFIVEGHKLFAKKSNVPLGFGAELGKERFPVGSGRLDRQLRRCLTEDFLEFGDKGDPSRLQLCTALEELVLTANPGTGVQQANEQQYRECDE